MSGIDYRSSLQTVLEYKFGHGHLGFEKSASRFLSSIMENFNKKLVNSFVSLALPKEINAACKVVQETIFGEDSQNLAITEGKRQMELFRTGVLYDFPSDRVEEPDIDYSPGLRSVLKRVQGELHIQLDAERNLSTIMRKFNEKLTTAFLENVNLTLQPAMDIILASEAVRENIAGDVQTFAVLQGKGQLRFFRARNIV